MTLTPEQRDAWRANAIQGGTGWPHETLALLDALDEAERAVADVQLAQAVAAVTPCSCSAQRARADRAEAAVQRVRDLHQPFEWSFGQGPVQSCRACADSGADEAHSEYPCPTARALDGDA